MTRTAIIAADGTLERVGPADGHDLTGRTVRTDVPDGWPETMRWDAATRRWAEDVGGVRAGMIGKCKAARMAAQAMPVAVPGVGTVQADPAGIAVIQSAVALAAASKAFGLPFAPLRLILLDNTVATLSADQVVAVATAIAASVQAAVDAYQAKRAALNAATSLAALSKITM